MTKYFAELTGTFILVVFGVGTAVVAGDKVGIVGIALAFGLALVCAAYGIGPVSGCHINPAVSLGVFVAGRMTVKDLIGYWVGQPYARQGLTLAAVKAVSRFSFERLALHRLEAACLPSNEASRGVLLKAGFSQEGLARAYLRINGIWEDHLLFGLVSPAPASEHRGEDVLV